jgi:hypothetical protein
MTTDDLLKQGIAALKAGHKTEARDLLMQAVEQDERNEMAWLWLSGAVDTDEDRRICLENVLTINPNSEIAQRGIELLRTQSAPGLDPAPDAESLQDKPTTSEQDVPPEPSTRTTTSPASALPASGHRTEEIPACSVCGRQDETLRLVVYPYVFSLLVVSFRRSFAGLWCKKHRNLRLALASFITATFGWLGIPHGILWTPVALAELVQGGRQPAELNASMLKTLAEHKIQQGDAKGAISCLEASLQVRDDEATRERLREIRTNFGLPIHRAGCRRTASTLTDLLLYAAGIGLSIGVLDYVITAILSSPTSGEVPLCMIILSWAPFVMMAFIGGLGLFQLIEWAIIQIRCRALSSAIGMGVVAAALAAYSILQGSAISDYVATLLFYGSAFESVSEVVFSGILVFLAGGFLWILEYIEPASISDTIYITLFLVIVAYYLAMTTVTAINTTRWQQRLVE